MSTPRQIVRDHLLNGLPDILKKNQYPIDVVTVELKERLNRDLNISDCPAIVVELGTDDEVRPETMGGNIGNQYFREWAIKLRLIMPDPGDREIEDAGEVFIGAVMKWCIRNRFANNGKPSNIRFTARLNEFERIENGKAESELDLIVRYDFTVGDL